MEDVEAVPESRQPSIPAVWFVEPPTYGNSNSHARSQLLAEIKPKISALLEKAAEAEKSERGEKDVETAVLEIQEHLGALAQAPDWATRPEQSPRCWLRYFDSPQSIVMGVVLDSMEELDGAGDRWKAPSTETVLHQVRQSLSLSNLRLIAICCSSKPRSHSVPRF